MTPPETNPYSVLGVPRNATDEQLKKAFRRKARTTHPDHGGDTAQFQAITEAYRVLSDPGLREALDGKTNNPSGTRHRTSPPAHASRTRRPAARASTESTTARDGRPTATATEESLAVPPEFRPPFSPGQPPLVPLSVAGQQSLSTPRRPGLLARLSPSAGERLDAQLRTVRTLSSTVLSNYPAGRLVNGVKFDDGTEAGSILLGGYRIAVLHSLIASADAYRWDGHQLLLRGRPVHDLTLRASVRSVQARFPGCHVSGWLVLHSLNGNVFEPVIDYPPGTDHSSLTSVHVVNVGALIRQLKAFMSTGPQPNVVQLPVLAGLLDAVAQ